MIELFLILFLCFMLTGVVLGHWIIYGGPNLKIFSLRKRIVGMGKPKGKTQIQIEAAAGPPPSWAAIGTNAQAVRRKKSA
jgi:hypothetical protein